MTIAVILTCFNRREKTLEFLLTLEKQSLLNTFSLNTVLVDDNSTDGTETAAREKFPHIQTLKGTGALFWCGGMRAAWREAASRDPDYYFLANDDTLLDEDALLSLLEIAQNPNDRIIAVGAIRDPISGEPTYGGIRRKTGRIIPTGNLEKCDTFNANAVLIPRAVYEEIGVFHDIYTHGMGDYDYGFQASRRGIQIIQSARTIGTCSRNSLIGTWRDSSLPRSHRLRLLQSPKGLPFKEWVTYNRRNAGWIWPYRCISPFLRILLGR
jgi:GT2 family glycosyltransferase